MTQEARVFREWCRGASVADAPIIKHTHLQFGQMEHFESEIVVLCRLNRSNYYIGVCSCGSRFAYQEEE